MSKSSRARNLTDTNATLIRVSQLLRRFEQTMADEALGKAFGSGGDMGGSSTTGHISDRTATIATTDSRARSDERQADRLLKGMAVTAATLERLMRYWTDDIPLKAEELAKLERQADPGCEHLAKIGTWEPVYQQATTVGGRLPREYRLARWTYDFVGRHDRLPTEVECRTHARGQRVLVSA